MFGDYAQSVNFQGFLNSHLTLEHYETLQYGSPIKDL